MKAIHNKVEVFISSIPVGNYKLKYNFESNSQPSMVIFVPATVGNYKLKYNFESNSQQTSTLPSDFEVGNYKLKYNFESNSQLPLAVICAKVGWEL